MWQKNTGGGVIKVKVNIHKTDIIIIDKEGVQEAIMTNNDKRCILTYGASLMNGSILSKDIGFLGKTVSTKKILNRTYNFPPGIDSRAICLLKCIGDVAKWIEHDPIDVKISTVDYKKYGNKRKGKNSSS